jgi:hypothetical protein
MSLLWKGEELVICPLIEIYAKHRLYSRHTTQVLEIINHKSVVDSSPPAPCPRMVQYDKRLTRNRGIRAAVNRQNARDVQSIDRIREATQIAVHREPTPRRRTAHTWTDQLCPASVRAQSQQSLLFPERPSRAAHRRTVTHDQGMTVIDDAGWGAARPPGSARRRDGAAPGEAAREPADGPREAPDAGAGPAAAEDRPATPPPAAVEDEADAF